MTDNPPSEAPNGGDTGRRPAGRWGRRVQPVSLAVAAAFLLADQLSKSWAVASLKNERVVHVIGSLHFNLSYNSGMAFGRGRGMGPIIGVIALVVVVYLLIGLRTSGSRLGDRKSTRLNSSHTDISRMPSSA